jgi:hypothetical protein
MALCLVILAGVATGSARASHGFPRHKCGSFTKEVEGTAYDVRVTVYNGNHLPCRVATQVIEAFWGPEENITSHGGPSEAQTFYTIKGFPGWRCYTGAGAGSCVRKHRVAAYAT